ncbi:multiple epidermal growth factor-like domains protein 6 [Bolinopsis microptera]|uniref:multiple epidermal growth factor-like domains protein 6 n=1 Tax=Bolinopsis microptera TaxID=2820187 RepID=UPI0030794292
MMLLLKITFLAILVKHVDCSFELVDQYGNTITTEGEEGLLLYNGGTVCDDHYDTDNNASNAVCKLMGFEAFSSHTNSHKWKSLQDSYSITLDQVKCSSTEWSSCTYVDSTHDCGHGEDVFLTCRGVCSPGQHRSSGTCVNCSSNTFKVETGIQRCIPCPEGAISQIGASQNSQCITCPAGSRPLDERAACSCAAGQIWTWTDRTSGSCTLCPEGSASPGGSLTCTECPSGSTPLQNGTSCSCEPGRIWSWDEKNNGSCELCPLNTYKDNHMLICTACPEFSSSTEGSATCKCTGGMFLNGTICLSCPSGKYKDEVMLKCENCPESSVSPEGALQCLICTSGSNSLNSNTICRCPRGMIWTWTNLTSGSCSICPPKTYKDSQLFACTPCGKFSQSTAGSERCTCVAGTYKNPNMTFCTMCPEGTSSEADSEHCICSAGQFWNGTLCQVCKEGSASPGGSLTCSECPSGSTPLHNGTSCSCPIGTTWNWRDQISGSCGLCPANTFKTSQMSSCAPCPPLSTSTAGSSKCSCLPHTYKNSNMTSCAMCPEGTNPESDSEHCTCSAGQLWNRTLCEICNVGSVSLIGALECQQCPPDTSADTMTSICTCRDGKTWSWSDQGNGSCVSLQPFHTSLKNQNKSIAILAGALGLSVLLSLLLGLLLFYERRNGRKQATGPRVVYTAEGEVGIGDQQSEARRDPEDPRIRQVIENEAVCHVNDVQGSTGGVDEDIYADEDIYDTI